MANQNINIDSANVIDKVSDRRKRDIM